MIGQCKHVFRGQRGLVVFCTKHEHHTGDHRGDRVQWRTLENGQNMRVWITITLREVEQANRTMRMRERVETAAIIALNGEQGYPIDVFGGTEYTRSPIIAAIHAANHDDFAFGARGHSEGSIISSRSAFELGRHFFRMAMAASAGELRWGERA